MATTPSSDEHQQHHVAPHHPPPQPFEVTVARKLDSLSHSLLETFLRLDVDRDGYVTRSDLKTALHNVLGINLSATQMDALFLRFASFELDDGRNENGIRYQEFVQYMDETARQRLSITVATSGSTLLDTAAVAANDEDDDESSFEEMLPIVISPKQERSRNRRELLRLLQAHTKSSSGGSMATTTMFLQMDTQRSGKISSQEFCDWVNHRIGKTLLTPLLFEELIGEEYYKKDGMDYEEFVSFMKDLEKEQLGGNKSLEIEFSKEDTPTEVEKQAREHYQEAVDDCIDNAKSDVEIARVIAEKLFSKRVKLVEAFHKYDLDGSGRLNAQDLCQALNEAGLHISVERSQSLVDKFDLDGDGRLNKGEFVRLIASSNDTDNDNDDDDEVAAATTTEELRRSLVAPIVGHKEKDHHEEIANRFDKDDIALLLSFRESLEAEKIMTRKLFQNMDKDGSKSLSAEELKEGFENMGVDISQKHIDHIMNRFETEGTGNMKYYQFVKLISANLDHSLDETP